jgi:hypothetical protein
MTDAYTINQKSRSICTINRECRLRDTRIRSIGCIPLKKGLEDIFWDDGKEIPIPFITSPEMNRVLRSKRVDDIYFVCSESDTAC